MNTYFCKIGSHLQQLMPNCGTEYNRYLSSRVNNKLVLSPVNENVLLKEIKVLNPRKSSGADNIGTRIVQLCPAVFGENLIKLYIYIVKIEYPVQLEIAGVIELYKGGEIYNPENYRPISLLSCVNKLFEKNIMQKACPLPRNKPHVI